MYSNMRPTGIEGCIPKQHFNNATHMLPARKRLNFNVQNRSSTTRNDYAECPTKQVKVSPIPKLDMTTEDYDTYPKTKLWQSNTVPTEIPEVETIGKSLLGLMCKNPPYAKDHDAIPLLKGYARDGYTLDCGDDWTQEHIELMLQRGTHRSAFAKKAVRQLCQETADKITHKYTRMVKWGEIKTKIPKKLKISPVAMIPHKSKPYRCIMDL